MNRVVSVDVHEIERRWVFARYVKELSIHVLLYTARDLLKAYINRWRGWL